MSRPPLVIEAIGDESERGAFTAASGLLRELLVDVEGGVSSVDMRIRTSGDENNSAVQPAAIIRSLLPEAALDKEALPETKRRLERELSALKARAGAVLICTVFRGVGRTSPEQQKFDTSRLERIRRVNLLAVELSHEFDVSVIDIDRVFAHLGGRALGCDYRPLTSLAANAAAYTIVSELLELAPELGIPPELEERAKAVYGGAPNLLGFLQRRLPKAGNAGTHERH